MVMGVLKFVYVWHRSTLYVWQLCPSFSLLCMNLRCILVAMIVHTSHGYTLYWYATMKRSLLDMSQSIDVLQKIWVDDDLRSSEFFPQSDNLFLQIFHLSYSSSLVLWGTFCYTHFSSPPCTENQNIRNFLKSSKYEVRLRSGLMILHLCPPPLLPFGQCALPFSVMPFFS